MIDTPHGFQENADELSKRAHDFFQNRLRQPVAPFIELALRLRDEARRERRYPETDLVRDALAELGIEVRDRPVGPQWSSRTEH